MDIFTNASSTPLRVESQRALSLGKNNALRCYIKLCFEALGGV